MGLQSSPSPLHEKQHGAVMMATGAHGTGPNTPIDMSQQDSDDVESKLRNQIIAALKTIYDPELPVNIYELGLIYGIDILPLGRVVVKMTLTSPACPVAGSLPGEVEVLVRAVRGVNEAEVQLVWDPPWSPDLLSDDTKLELNLL